MPVDLAQELGQSAGEKREIKLVSDEVPSLAQEINQVLSIGVQLCGHRGRDMALAPHQKWGPSLHPSPGMTPSSPHRLVLAWQVSSARRAQVARP